MLDTCAGPSNTFFKLKDVQKPLELTLAHDSACAVPDILRLTFARLGR